MNQNIIMSMKRYNREGDLRASGSGDLQFMQNNDLDKSLLKLVLNTTIKVKMNFAA